MRLLVPARASAARAPTFDPCHHLSSSETIVHLAAKWTCVAAHFAARTWQSRVKARAERTSPALREPTELLNQGRLHAKSYIPVSSFADLFCSSRVSAFWEMCVRSSLICFFWIFPLRVKLDLVAEHAEDRLILYKIMAFTCYIWSCATFCVFFYSGLGRH